MPMNYLDLSYEGRHQAEKTTIDNGKLPHGGYRGSRKHPPSGLSIDKSREFRQSLEREVSQMLTDEDVSLHGRSPAWSLMVHKQPSFTDESPLFAQSFLAASKYEPTDGITLLNRTSLLPNKPIRARRNKNSGDKKYYRPNRTHQYLTATELRDHSKDQVNVAHGRPTRTTLLRARTKCMSATSNSYETRREIIHKIDDVKTSIGSPPSSAEYLQLRTVREAESLHSYLTGARYNRANCLDSKSVENSGLYIPRSNTANGSIFRGPKGQEYLREFVESSLRAPPLSARRRPTTAPQADRRPLPTSNRVWPDQKKKGRRPHPRSAEDVKRKQSKLNVIGCRLQIGLSKDLNARIASMQRADSTLLVDDNYIPATSQPPPTPNSMAATLRDVTAPDDSEAEEEVREGEQITGGEEETSVKDNEGEKEDEVPKDEESVEKEIVNVPMVVVDTGGDGGEEKESIPVEIEGKDNLTSESEQPNLEIGHLEEAKENSEVCQEISENTEATYTDNQEDLTEGKKEVTNDDDLENTDNVNTEDDATKAVDESIEEDKKLELNEGNDKNKKKRIGSGKEVRFFLTEDEKTDENEVEKDNNEETSSS